MQSLAWYLLINTDKVGGFIDEFEFSGSAPPSLMKTLKESLNRAQVQQVSNKKRKMSEREYVDLTEEETTKQRKLESATVLTHPVEQELPNSQLNAVDQHKNSGEKEGVHHALLERSQLSFLSGEGDRG